MRNFTQEESARIRREMRKRLGRHVASKIRRQLEFIKAGHVNRCFPLGDLKDRLAELDRVVGADNRKGKGRTLESR